MAVFVTRYDFRAPDASPEQRQELFARAVRQAAYVDRHGHDVLLLSEHHASADGYLPSPLVVAGAFAAVTERIQLSVSALLANLYDPVRLAEDISVLDHLSKGRVSYTFGLGYRTLEYDLLERDWHTRGADLEARLQTLLAALRGEEIDRGGQRHRITPAPYSQPHPMFLQGGGSVAAARRAARLGIGFAPQTADPGLRAAYEDACRDLGRDPGWVMAPPRSGPAAIFCSEEPGAFWEQYGTHLLHDATAYQAWRDEAGRDPATATHVADASTSVEEMRAAGVYAVLHPDDLIARLQAKEIRVVTSHPSCGGLPEEPSWEHLRLLAERVIPAVRG
ncbi:LLM class flavin-dependent oxidoreductase [Nocardioides daejeonensis]|uniref:LLM class flavin-dependent oxidoreductase n=1 Tax=Nocardioides daejeonensis TaxID=1046556 RepID=UPI000D74D76F|nr:LLM class flavin-dependent oxidoreductase [Nocardioides daejeonensis]